MNERDSATLFSLPPARIALAGGLGMIAAALGAVMAWNRYWLVDALPARHVPITSRPGYFAPAAGGGGDGDILFVGGDVTAPVIERRVPPTYTAAARRAGVEGTVILGTVIGADGAVRGVRVLKSLPMGLDQEAIEAVQGWKFRPGRRGEQAVDVYFTLAVRFELQ